MKIGQNIRQLTQFIFTPDYMKPWIMIYTNSQCTAKDLQIHSLITLSCLQYNTIEFILCLQVENPDSVTRAVVAIVLYDITKHVCFIFLCVTTCFEYINQYDQYVYIVLFSN